LFRRVNPGYRLAPVDANITGAIISGMDRSGKGVYPQPALVFMPLALSI
jgi:hypothetical protein